MNPSGLTQQTFAIEGELIGGGGMFTGNIRAANYDDACRKCDANELFLWWRFVEANGDGQHENT